MRSQVRYKLHSSKTTVMMLLRVPAEEEAKMRKSLERVEGKLLSQLRSIVNDSDLKVAVDRTTLTSVPRPQWKRRIIRLTGADNTGLVAGNITTISATFYRAFIQAFTGV